MNLDQSYVNSIVSSGTDNVLELIFKFGNLWELFDNRNAVKTRNNYGLSKNWRVYKKSELSKSEETLNLLAFELLPEKLNEIAPFGTTFGEHPSEKNKYGFWKSKS